MEYKNKNSSEPSFLSFIAFFLVFTSIFITLLSSKNKDSTFPKITKTLFSTLTPASADKTQNWQPYNNKITGLSFKYPQSWTINHSSKEVLILENKIGEKISFYFLKDGLGRGYQGIKKFIKYDIEVKNNKIILKNENELITENLETMNGEIKTQGYAILATTNNLTILMEGSDETKTNDSVLLFEKIINTIKTENSKNITNETQNWQTYTNSTYKYSIKYPSDWLINKTISSNNSLCLSTNKQYSSDIGPICSLRLTTYYESALFDNKKSNLDNWINLQVSNGIFYKKETINMFSKPAYKISSIGESETKSIYFEKNNNIFEISNNFGEISETEQQIINSLKFD